MVATNLLFDGCYHDLVSKQSPKDDLGHQATIAGAQPGDAIADTEVGLNDPLPSTIRPGDRIAHFEILRVLGRGAMGIVLSARDTRLNRDVAIKVVRPYEGDISPDATKARLLREAQAMANLRHPNVVTVYEAGEVEGQVFMAMEQIEGGDLRRHVEELRDEGDLDWRMVLELFAAAGRGLAAAHEQGLVHRDFKTDNVLVDDKGRVLVTDFGIVAQDDSSPEEVRRSTSKMFVQHLTIGDSSIGTPAYMAPEQHRSGEVDERADQFAFCASLYEALYGQLPFAGTTLPEYLDNVEAGAIRDPEGGWSVPNWLRDALLRGLSREPDKRFASMNELLGELGHDPAQHGRLGSRERIIFAMGLAAFAVAWTASVLGFDVELSYGLHYVTDAGFFALTLLLGWFGRHALGRSAFNRSAYGFLVAVSAALLLLVLGAHLLALSPETIGVLHLLVIGACAATSVPYFGLGLLPMALGYLGAFLIAAAHPTFFLPILLSAHIIGGVTVFKLFRSRS